MELLGPACIIIHYVVITEWPSFSSHGQVFSICIIATGSELEALAAIINTCKVYMKKIISNIVGCYLIVAKVFYKLQVCSNSL